MPVFLSTLEQTYSSVALPGLLETNMKVCSNTKSPKRVPHILFNLDFN